MGKSAAATLIEFYLKTLSQEQLDQVKGGQIVLPPMVLDTKPKNGIIVDDGAPI